MRGIEPRAFHMQSERSTTELHPHWLPARKYLIYKNEPRLTKPFIDDIRNISSNRIWNISRFASEMGLNFRAKYLPASWFGSRFENFLNQKLKIFHGINLYLVTIWI